MTPIFYHSKQQITPQFISVQKIPEFVRKSGRKPFVFDPYQSTDFFAAHDSDFVRDVLACMTYNGFRTLDPEINTALHHSNASMGAAVQPVLQHGGIAGSASQSFHHSHNNYENAPCNWCYRR